MTSRYSNTNDLGVSILNLCISKNFGWICRNTTNSDVGIDATIEQVINGLPTAKYISIQLKTGLGNVQIDKNCNFTYYIDNIHYEYWLSSSVPVILALCDPEKEIIYWELVKKHNISKTDKKHKIAILNTHQLNKDSLNELNTIIYRWENVQFQTKFNYKVFWIIIALVVFISLILIFRNYVLNNHNKYK